MDLIQRYLQAVGFWLPKQQRQDILAELSEDIHAQLDEEEAALGHRMTEVEIEALLKKRGRPIFVANRYLPQQYLIGPLLFPMYRFVIKVVLLCYLVPWVLVWLGVIFSPIYATQHPGASWISALASLPGTFWHMAFASLGGVTIVFAILERAQAKSGFLADWDPRKLPPVRNPNQIPITSSAFELVINLMVFGWWAANMYSPFALLHSDVRLMLSSIWPVFYWGFLLIVFGNVALAAAGLRRPYWSVSRAVLRLLADCAGGALFCWLLEANVLAGISAANLSPQRAFEITSSINLWMSRSFAPAIIVCVIIAWVDVYRIMRLRNTTPGAIAEAASII